MRISDLLGAHVYDRNGEKIGTVHDVRMTRDGPMVGDFGAAYSVHGIVIGELGLATRLGFDRRKVLEPAPLKGLFRWLLRKNRYATWDQIGLVAERAIRLRVAAADLEPPGEKE